MILQSCFVNKNCVLFIDYAFDWPRLGEQFFITRLGRPRRLYKGSDREFDTRSFNFNEGSYLMDSKLGRAWRPWKCRICIFSFSFWENEPKLGILFMNWRHTSYILGIFQQSFFDLWPIYMFWNYVNTLFPKSEKSRLTFIHAACICLLSTHQTYLR